MQQDNGQRRVTRDRAAGASLELSIIIPAHNEADRLPATLACAFAAARASGATHEIVVVDDASTDGTGAVAWRAGAKVVRVAHRQISATRNAGVRASVGRVLVFVDADTLVPAETLTAALRAIEAGAVAGGSAMRLDEPVSRWARWSVSVWNAVAHAAGWAAGCFLFCRREAFERAGGFDERYYAAEDLMLSRALGRTGRFVSLRQRVVTSGRKVRTGSSFGNYGAILWKVLATRGTALHRREGLELWYERDR